MTGIKAPPLWMRQTLQDLLRHEGFREFAYPDPLSILYRKHKNERWGFVPAAQILEKIGVSFSAAEKAGAPWTVGVGFTNGVSINSQMKLNVAMHKLEDVVLDHLWILDKAMPKWLDMPDVVKSVLANLAFNLGNGLFKFKNTIKLFNAGKFAAAGDGLKASLWYKQVGNRAIELVKRLKTGEIEPEHKVK